MYFVVVAHDGTDENALQRRQAVREAHLTGIDKLRRAGNVIMACALLNDNEIMAGSTLVCAFDSRQNLDAWLKIEPYVTGNVWQKINVYPCKIPPAFID